MQPQECHSISIQSENKFRTSVKKLTQFASLIVIAGMIILPHLAFAGEPPSMAKQENSHLISYLKDSGCRFNRNGTWYSSADAVDHLNKKFQYLLDKGMVSSAEDFITRAASESSISHKPYLVKCSTNPAVKSGPWLKSELIRYRSTKK